MNITLKQRDIRQTSPLKVVQWKKSLPFFLNFRGLLIHRVESVTTYVHRDDRKHNAVHYLCNGQTTGEGEFLAKPPANRLVCQACELAAKRKGKPSSAKLVGRHVHIGRIRAERVCCNGTASRN